MDDGSPTLEVGFAIDTGGSFESLTQLDNLIDSATANALAEFAKVERASKGMLDLGSSTLSIGAFGNAVTRAGQDANVAFAQAERSGETLSRQLERQISTFAKTRDEIRATKVETAALAAEQKGMTELAGRLRAQEAALYAEEYAVTRKASQAAEALAQDKLQAASQSVAAAEREAKAVREAAHAYEMFQARVRQGVAAMREQATAAQELARIDQTRSTTAAAASTQRLAREQALLVSAVRGSQAAMEADAGAAERLRQSTDPLYAATSRLNAEIAESTRLYHNGATAPAEYARQQDVLTGRLRDVVRQSESANRSTGSLGATGKLAGHHTQNLAFQFQDLGVQLAGAAGSSAPFKLSMMAIIQQGSQIQGIMSQAGIGIKGVAVAFGQMSKSILLATLTNPYLLAFAAAVTVIAGSIKLMQNAANDDKPMKAYAASLGLSVKEIRNLDNVTVTFGDTAKAVFQVAGAAIWSGVGSSVTGVWGVMKEWLTWIGSGVKTAINFTIGAFVGGFNAIKATWSALPGAMGDIFFSAVNFSIEAINSLIRKSVEGINGFIATANGALSKLGFHLPELDAPQIAKVDNQFAGAAAKVGKTIRDEMGKAIGVDYLGKAGGAIVGQAQKNARDRLKKQAEDKGYLDPEKGKTDKHAEQLARNAEAVEAQIRNLYALAAAYGVSGAAALIAEARVKAESQAIKQRGDIEAAVARQVALAIAQRVADAAKSTAAMRDQTAVQDLANAAVAAGNVPAEQAAEFIRNQMADLPLLAALEAANLTNNVAGAAEAATALAKQRDARDKLTDSERRGQLVAAMASGADKLVELREELALIGATDAARVHALATLKATQEATANNWTGPKGLEYIDQQVKIADTQQLLAQAQTNYNNALNYTADKWELIAQNVQAAGQGMSDAFGATGRAIGDMASIYAGYQATRTRSDAKHKIDLLAAGKDQAAIDRVNNKFALSSATAQIGAFGDMAQAAKGFFDEKSKGYQAMMVAEKVFRTIEFALSVKAMVQDAIETGTSLAKSAARTAAKAVEAVVSAIASLPFPLNIAAGAATIAALAAIGVSIAGSFGGGSKNTLPAANTGTGTVLGDKSSKSDSIKNAIDALKAVDTLTNTYARTMAASLKSIDNQIGGFASQIVRAGNVNASAGVTEGFQSDLLGKTLSAGVSGIALGAIGSLIAGPIGFVAGTLIGAVTGIVKKIPIIGGIVGALGNVLGSLFGSKTTVLASGLFGKKQTIGSVLDSGFDAQYYSDVQKKKKFLGITSGTSYSTQYGEADAGLENQFTLILKQFNNAIAAAAGPLGVATGEVQSRLNSFVVDIGKIDLQGLTGAEIEEKLSAVFGAAADGMANAAIPGLAQFQKVGEGAFETLIRVALTVESVSASLDMLGNSAQSMGVASKLGLAEQFESVSALTDAAGAYFGAYYSAAEQAAAKTAQMAKVFGSLGLAVPATLAGYRQLVEAQDLNTVAGQATYATLLKLAPAFADLQVSMEGVKSAADVASEKLDLQRQLLELQGDTAAIRALDLAKLDESNRGLQQQIWAVQDAKAAADAAKQLADAWTSVGDSILAEVNRIRGITDASGGNSFASLMGQFNAATVAARGGDQDAAKSLPGLSQALLTAAGNAATSRQELDRIQAQTAASLEATYGVINSIKLMGTPTTSSTLSDAAAAAQAATTPAAANDDMASEIRALRDELAGMRADNNAGHATNASANAKTSRILENVTAASGGEAISVANAA